MTSRRQEKREKRAREQWAADLKWLVSAPHGRRILANLIDRSGYGRDAFTGNSQGNYLQGRQSVVGELVTEIKMIALADFHRMEAEAMNAQQRIADEATADSADDAE